MREDCAVWPAQPFKTFARLVLVVVFLRQRNRVQTIRAKRNVGGFGIGFHEINNADFSAFVSVLCRILCLLFRRHDTEFSLWHSFKVTLINIGKALTPFMQNTMKISTVKTYLKQLCKS